MPIDFGTHHCFSSSGLVHASNTKRAGASKVRVPRNSTSDGRSRVVGFFIDMGTGSLSFSCVHHTEPGGSVFNTRTSGAQGSNPFAPTTVTIRTGDANERASPSPDVACRVRDPAG